MIEKKKREGILYNYIEGRDYILVPRVLDKMKQLLRLRKFVFLWCKKNQEKINPFYREKYNGSYIYDTLQLVLSDIPLPPIRKAEVFTNTELHHELVFTYKNMLKKYIPPLMTNDFFYEPYDKRKHREFEIFAEVIRKEIRRFRKYFQVESEKELDLNPCKSIDFNPEYIITNKFYINETYGDYEFVINGVGPVNCEVKFNVEEEIKKKTIFSLIRRQEQFYLSLKNIERPLVDDSVIVPE